MRLLLLFLALCSVANAQTAEELKKQYSNVLIYIDDLGPDDHSTEYWEKCCLEACDVWLTQAGFTVTRVSKRTDAEIVFIIGILEKRYGQCNREPWVKFPHIPNKSDKLIITIDRRIKSMPHKNLTPVENLMSVLKHEVGHAIGLDHTTGSIVTDEWPRPKDLMPFDKNKILELKKYLESK